jgi:uncharacterized 2Fe-2S/4Fe-4S cluster protein (DUF4445 family)
VKLKIVNYRDRPLIDNLKNTKFPERWVKTISLTPPSLKDNTADADRLAEALKRELKTDFLRIDLPLIRILPNFLRKCNFQVRCVIFKDRGQYVLAGILDSQSESPALGLAVDLGTSRVVIRLLNLENGSTLGESAFDNPQGVIGPDILMRIHFADSIEGLNQLNELIIQGLNLEIGLLCEKCATLPENIYLMAVAGNTTMTHLFLKIEPHWIIREPYIPGTNRPGLVKAAELGIVVNPFAWVMTFPNIGSYFGGDLIAGILFSGISKRPETAILVDVGTNAEVVLGNENWLIACAGAAGPALEGGVTRMGMMAGPGVIDKISINPETMEFNIHTIENKPPVGICGSGLIDLAAQLFLTGMIDIRGKFIPLNCGIRLKEADEIPYLEVVPAADSATGKDLSITQVDIDSLIRSKAAMFTILETITNTVGIGFSELSTFYVAGTFGSFINPFSAISIGMLPDIPLEFYRPLGNSSLGGATLVLIEPACIAEIDKIKDRITYLELNVNQDFMNRFSAAKFIPHTDPIRFPSVKRPI